LISSLEKSTKVFIFETGVASLQILKMEAVNVDGEEYNG